MREEEKIDVADMEKKYSYVFDILSFCSARLNKENRCIEVTFPADLPVNYRNVYIFLKRRRMEQINVNLPIITFEGKPIFLMRELVETVQMLEKNISKVPTSILENELSRRRSAEKGAL